MRIDNALTWAAEQLEGGESPSVDAKVMLANILGKSQTYLFTWPDKTLDAAQKAQPQGLSPEGDEKAHIGPHQHHAFNTQIENTTFFSHKLASGSQN